LRGTISRSTQEKQLHQKRGIVNKNLLLKNRFSLLIGKECTNNMALIDIDNFSLINQEYKSEISERLLLDFFTRIVSLASVLTKISKFTGMGLMKKKDVTLMNSYQSS
jgi:GGDEF domain-containing protein